MKNLLLIGLLFVSDFAFAGLPNKLDICRKNPSDDGLYNRVEQFWIDDDHGALDCEGPGHETCQWVSSSSTYNFEKITFDLIQIYILEGKTSGTVNISGENYSYYILEGFPDLALIHKTQC